MRRLYKEPLVHFLLLGGLVFAVHSIVKRESAETPEVVRITAADVSWLRETWKRQWLRPPSDAELRGLLAEYLKEDLLARQAREIGLDQNDTIVRRRLAQKMEFIVQDTARLAEPSERELHRLYEANIANYQYPATVSFTQLFFKTAQAAHAGLAALASDGDADVGERTLLERDHFEVDELGVASLFGPRFAEALFRLEAGRWHGPVESAYGFHLVWISEHRDGQIRAFDDVRDKVLDEWHRAQQEAMTARFFSTLLTKYDVQVDAGVEPLLGPWAQNIASEIK